MENNEDIVLSEPKVGKEYEIPELVDLNCIGKAAASNCFSGYGALWSCVLGL